MESAVGVLVFIVVSIVIFLICRELVCWYWKINESLKVQKEISAKLDRIIRLLQYPRDSDQS